MDEEWINEYLELNIHDSFFVLLPQQSEETNTAWSKEENRAFENALVEFLDSSSPTFFENLASRVPSKSIEAVKNHYQALVIDLANIEAGLIEPPEYKDAQCNLKVAKNGQGSSSKQQKGTGGQRKRSGVHWTEKEHRAFLLGLEKCGKGDWKTISRLYVVTKTPTQVASHAQKYFRRLQSSTRPSRRRPSIHDIQNVTSSTTISTATNAVTVPQSDHVNLQQGEEQLPLPNSFSENNIIFSSPITTTTTTIPIPSYDHMNAQRTKEPIASGGSGTLPNPETSTMMPFSSSFSENNIIFSSPITTTTTTIPIPSYDHMNAQRTKEPIASGGSGTLPNPETSTMMPFSSSFSENNIIFSSPITTTTTTIPIPSYDHMNAQRTKEPIASGGSGTLPNPETSTMMPFSSSFSENNIIFSSPITTTTTTIPIPSYDHMNTQRTKEPIASGGSGTLPNPETSTMMPFSSSFSENNIIFSSPITTTTTTIPIPSYNHMNTQRTKEPIAFGGSGTLPNPETSTMMPFSSSASASTWNTNSYWWD